MANKLKIIVFGGCFNPPTLAHQEIIEACLDLPDFHEIWLMPSASGYGKVISTTNKDRVAMLELVRHYQFNMDPKFVISDFELKSPNLEETCHTVSALHEEYKDNDFWFAFGADSYYDMPNWGQGEQLQSNLKMIIFERANMLPPNRTSVIPLSLASNGHLSSTMARRAAAQKSGLNNLVCPEVKEYIEQHKLYYR